MEYSLLVVITIVVLQSERSSSSNHDGYRLHDDNSYSFKDNESSLQYKQRFGDDFLVESSVLSKNHMGKNENSYKRRVSFVSQYSIKNSAIKCDSYVDVCGECGGGRVDSCNVCQGNNLCVSCNITKPGSRRDACGNCLLSHDDNWNDCWAMVSVHPNVLDKAVGLEAELRVELTRTPDGDKDIRCSLTQALLTLSIEKYQQEENWLVLLVPLNQLTAVGECRLQCLSSSGHSWGHQNLTVVNSRTLSVSSIFPSTLTFETPTQLKLVVHGVSTLVDLYCFITDLNRTIVQVLPTNEISGNPMTSTVVCPPISPRSGQTVLVGVTFSRAAVLKMMANNTISVPVQAISLKPTKAGFSEELSAVWVEFNQNIVGPADCSGVFRSSTYDLLGVGTKCTYLANRLVVQLGGGARLRPRDTLRFLQSTSLRFYGSPLPPTLQDDAVQLPTILKSSPQYRLVGPSRLCASTVFSSVAVVPLSAQSLLYNWSILVTEASSPSSSSVEGEALKQHQRRNLLVWFGAREILRPTRHNNLDKLKVNTSLLVQNINYRVEVVGQDMLGRMGPPVRLDMQLSTSTHVELSVLCPASALAFTPLQLEARLFSCGNVSLESGKFQFMWKVARGSVIVKLDSTSSKPTVPAASLQVPGVYNISCFLMKNTAVIAKGEAEVEIGLGEIHLKIIPAEILQDTANPVQLEVSRSPVLNSNPSAVQWQWRCEKEDGSPCVSPGSSQPVSITFSAALSCPRLVLPPGSLPVGKYKWSVEARLNTSVFSSSAVVQLAAGHLPLLSLSSPSATSRGLTLLAHVSGLRPGCLLMWDSVALIGYQFISVKNLTGRQLEVASSVSSVDFPLVIPAGILKPGVRHRLRLSADCGAAAFAYVDISVSLPFLPKTTALQVTPQQGLALQTQFTFSTERSSQFPVTYSFGFYLASGPPFMFFTSAYSFTAKTTLPGLSDGSSQVRTVLRVCDAQQLCTITNGPMIQISLPASLSPQQISEISRSTSVLLRGAGLEEGVALAVAALTTTKLLADQTPYIALSTSFVADILFRINQTSQRLSQDMSTRLSAMLLLESVTRVLPLLQLNDSALSQVVAFRDKIASMGHQALGPSRILEPSLEMEPRAERSKRQHPIPPNTPPETPDTVGVWLQTSETAILSFSANKSEEERRRLVTNLDSYVAGLCRGLMDSSQPIFLATRVVNLSVQKVSVSESFKKNLSVPTCLDSCSSSTAKLILGKTFANQYQTVDSICLSGLQFPPGSLDAVFPPSANFTPLSAIYSVKVSTFSVSADLPALPAPSLVLYIPLLSDLTLPSHVPQCYVITSGSWTSEGCESELSGQIAICKCPAYSYYSVFSKPISATASTSSSDANLQVTEMQGVITSELNTAGEITTASIIQPTTFTPTALPVKVTTASVRHMKKVAFRIAENFEIVVGNNMSEFSRLIKKQVIEQLNLPKGIIRDIYVTRGSIQVTLSLQSTDQLSAEECVAELSQALGEGQLTLRGPDNHSLEVPRQPLQVLRDPRGRESGLSSVFLASTAAAVCSLFLLYTIMVTLLTKKTRHKEALRIAQRKAAQTLPRYLAPPLPHTLNGTNQASRRGITNGEDTDSGIYNSDGVRRNGGGGKDGGPIGASQTSK